MSSNGTTTSTDMRRPRTHKGRDNRRRRDDDDAPRSETDLQPKDPREGIDQERAHNPVNPDPDPLT